MKAIATAHTANRAQVLRMAKAGMPDHQIAFTLSVSIASLRSFYGDAIRNAEIAVDLAILESLRHLACSAKSVTAATFWARTRCGFAAQTKTVEPSTQNSDSSRPGQVFVVSPKGEKVGPR